MEFMYQYKSNFFKSFLQNRNLFNKLFSWAYPWGSVLQLSVREVMGSISEKFTVPSPTNIDWYDIYGANNRCDL